MAYFKTKDYPTNFRNTVTANTPKIIRLLFKLYNQRLDVIAQRTPTAADLRERKRSIDHTMRYLMNPFSIVAPHNNFVIHLSDVCYGNGAQITRGHFAIGEFNW